jgi:hypothetical protein
MRRSSDEIVKIDHRERVRKFNPLVPALLTIGLLTMCAILGPPSSRPLFTSPHILLLFLLIFGSFYLSQIILGQYWLFGRPTFSQGAARNKICPVCYSIYFTDSDACSCGGRLENLEYWKYVDNEQKMRENEDPIN